MDISRYIGEMPFAFPANVSVRLGGSRGIEAATYDRLRACFSCIHQRRARIGPIRRDSEDVIAFSRSRVTVGDGNRTDGHRASRWSGNALSLFGAHAQPRR